MALQNGFQTTSNPKDFKNFVGIVRCAKNNVEMKMVLNVTHPVSLFFECCYFSIYWMIDLEFFFFLIGESHQRQLLLFSDNSGKFLDSFSKEFETSFINQLKRAHGTKRTFANQVYQEYIKDKEHTHM